MSCVIAIGNFDGVHMGHRQILARARELAHARNIPVKAMTFYPSPAAVLRPGHESPRLARLRDRVRLLQQAGADEVIVLEPTLQLLAQSAREFLDRLVDEHHPAAIVEGENFRFGRDRQGDVQLLAQVGRELGFETDIVRSVQLALCDQLLVTVSSSLIRWLVGLGRVADAARCLGRPYELTATVVRGEQRGRQLGYPTANLDLAELAGQLVPGDGVYAGTVQLSDGRVFPAGISVGIKPTLKQRQLTIEAHLLGFQGDLYGQTATFRFSRWLRDQLAFPTLERLTDQLGRDLATCQLLHRAGLLDAAFAITGRAG